MCRRHQAPSRCKQTAVSPRWTACLQLLQNVIAQRCVWPAELSRNLSTLCTAAPASNWPVEGDERMNLLRPYVALTINSGNRTALAGYDVPHNCDDVQLGQLRPLVCTITALFACCHPFQIPKKLKCCYENSYENFGIGAQPNKVCFNFPLPEVRTWRRSDVWDDSCTGVM